MLKGEKRPFCPIKQVIAPTELLFIITIILYFCYHMTKGSFSDNDLLEILFGHYRDKEIR